MVLAHRLDTDDDISDAGDELNTKKLFDDIDFGIMVSPPETVDDTYN